MRACRNPRSRRAPRGFSYVEVLIAIVVLTVGMLGAMVAMGLARRQVSSGGRETVAAELARTILEQMRNASTYDDMLSYADEPPPGATSPRPEYVREHLEEWRGGSAGAGAGPPPGPGPSITIAQEGVPPNRLATITVGVDWPGRTGASAPGFVTKVAEWP